MPRRAAARVPPAAPPLSMLRHDVSEGFIGGIIAPQLGLSPETARLAALTILGLLVYCHGRSVLRAVSLLLISFTITAWALLRRVRKALFGNGAPAPSLKSSSPAEEKFPPLPAVKPTALAAAAKEVVRLHEDNDALGAARLLDALDAGLTAGSRREQAAVAATLGPATADRVRASRAATREALALFDDTDGGWTGSLTVLGATTRFRRNDGGGQMVVRVDGVLEGVSLADVLAVWRESDHFREWIPSCSDSRTLRRRGPVDVLLHVTLDVLGLVQREAVLHGVGVNCLDSHGAILVLAKSLTPSQVPEEAHLFPTPKATCMEYRRLQVKLSPLGPSSTRATLLMEVDPKLRIVPQGLVESVLRRTIGVIFWSLTRAAKRIGQRAGPHYRAVCADAEFYDGWLAPKIEAFFRARRAAAAGKA